jgi:hypothetical protein
MKKLGVRLLLPIAVSVLAAGAAGPSQAKTTPVGFGTPVYVDRDLAGGEPEVMADPLHGTLVYSSHEGTTHLYRDGLLNSPWGDFSFVSNYCNQVNVWTSTDAGVNWFRDRYLGTQCPTSPAINTGFSDPDLTMDAGGRIYDTGIDLANDALFSSTDGGRTWDRGTPNCHNGDRPWLAGGRANEVFMATDPVEDELNHRMFVSTDGGQTCSLTGIPDFGPDPATGERYTGFGKLYFDRARQRLAEPTVYVDANGTTDGIGVSTWSRGDAAFTPHFITHTSLVGFFPAIAIDAADTIYTAWTPNARQPGTSGGCAGAETPAPNSVMLAFSTDFGRTWSQPVTIYRPPNARALWPWLAAGDAGKISVVWYQTEPGELADNDCQFAHIHVFEAHILDATSGRRSVSVVDAAGRAVHYGTVCQGGTGCVVTGKDRRLGDYFVNALDTRGCVMISTADTMLTDPLTGAPLPTSRPLFIHQSSGPALRGKGTCS